MSDPRYHSGVIQGIALSRHHGAFPPAIVGLGAMRGAQPCGRCVFCPKDTHPQYSLTWVAYGGFLVCGACARRLHENETIPEVQASLARALGETEGAVR